MGEVLRLDGSDPTNQIPEDRWQCLRCGVVFENTVRDCHACEAERQEIELAVIMEQRRAPLPRPRTEKAIRRDFERAEETAMEIRARQEAENEFGYQVQEQAEIERGLEDA